MDLQKVSDEEKLSLCKKYFWGGFAALPFLWFVNFCWFFKYAFLRDAFPLQKEIRKYVIMSLVGSLIWILILIIWTIIFQTHRVAWGAMGDYLSFVFPRGKP